MKTFSRFLPRFLVFPLMVVLFALLVALAGCGDKTAPATGSSLTQQQKGVMGGTPPPGELAKIEAERAKQAQTQAAEQAKESAAAAAKGGQ